MGFDQGFWGTLESSATPTTRNPPGAHQRALRICPPPFRAAEIDSHPPSAIWHGLQPKVGPRAWYRQKGCPRWTASPPPADYCSVRCWLVSVCPVGALPDVVPLPTGRPCRWHPLSTIAFNSDAILASWSSFFAARGDRSRSNEDLLLLELDRQPQPGRWQPGLQVCWKRLEARCLAAQTAVMHQRLPRSSELRQPHERAGDPAGRSGGPAAASN